MGSARASRTTSCRYAAMGAGQKIIAQLLGHADTSASERYTHVAVDVTRPIVEARWAQLVERSES